MKKLVSGTSKPMPRPGGHESIVLQTFENDNFRYECFDMLNGYGIILGSTHIKIPNKKYYRVREGTIEDLEEIINRYFNPLPQKSNVQ